MTEKDYVAEFGQWTFKPNYPYSHMHGLAVSVDILNKISEHYNSFENRSVAEKRVMLSTIICVLILHRIIVIKPGIPIAHARRQ